MFDSNERSKLVKTLAYNGPQTQKAKGISLIANFLNTFSVKPADSLPYVAYTASEIIDANESKIRSVMDEIYNLVQEFHTEKIAVFARPCPMQPRHGFVDSRLLLPSIAETTDLEPLQAFRLLYKNSVLQVAEETFAADPNGEIIFMKYLKADYNYILTPSSVTIGMGHDGATAGKNAITLPIYSPMLDKNKMSNISYNEEMRGKIFTRMGIGDEETPYFELVSVAKRSLPSLVQVRSGPFVEAEQNYIPRDIVISSIYDIDSDVDLLTWEAEAKEIAKDENAVVYHRNGSINSHFGVHCVINKISYVTTDRPSIGEKLFRTQKASWSNKDYEKLARYIAYYDTEISHQNYFEGTVENNITSSKAPQSYGMFALAGLHAASTLMQTRNDYAYRALAASIVFCARMFSAIVLGEYRHAKVKTKSNSPARFFYSKIQLEIKKFPLDHDRDSIYISAMQENNFYNLMFSDCLTAYYIFSQPAWEESYGGKPWKQCAKATIIYGRMLAAFITEPNAVNFTALMNEFNTIIHLAHNNGWWLNKIMPKETLEMISQNPIRGFLSKIIYSLLTKPDFYKYNLSCSQEEGFEYNLKYYQANLNVAKTKALLHEKSIVDLIESEGWNVYKEE